MRAELKALQKRLGITTIYVTHDQVEALTMADRVAILHKGILQQLAEPNEIYNRPENIFVGGFIGNPPLNLLPCSLLEEKGKMFLKSDDFLIDMTVFKDELKKGSTTKELVLGFRPEDAHIHRTKLSSDSMEAKVYVTEPLGAQLLITLIPTCNELIKIIEKSNFKVNIGEKVGISLDKNKIHVFDKKTGKSIR
jgi:ABC-type sugar transport system ATPase subunit